MEHTCGGKEIVQAMQLISNANHLFQCLILHCESCQFEKHTSNSFLNQVNKWDKSLFALVHLYIWVSSRVVTHSNFKYFVTFFDDYSHCTWVCLMENKSELFSIFKTFYNGIKTQFGILSTLCMVIMLVNIYPINFNILYQTSCAHTPQ